MGVIVYILYVQNFRVERKQPIAVAITVFAN
jgi:hypothetical protein